MYYYVIFIFISIFGNRYKIKILPKISIKKIFQKVDWVFEKGQKKMSIFEKSKKVLKKGIEVDGCDENALIFVF